ncbi:RHS repeat-associated core domain containing protein [Nitzschia inconspicua]|uniref:RHS repeat-associated core domain containing protein n=1 Tax=Nitzschia inconspicua TaxID=303405 RepID=A0A9K3K6X2_9STRA|nr:RHS repeat-associated core domain containing protein [Nitzschia inconspicua]
MDAADYLSRSSRNLRSSVETFTDEVEGELEKYSICGVHLTRKVTVYMRLPRVSGDCARFRKLNFNENGLSGTISEDIGLLSNTREFRVEGNAIEGTIPKSFGLMRELLGLNLHNNKIHGIFPQSLATLKQLEVAKFSNNRLEGLDGIGIWKQLPNLQVIHLFNNTLTGRLGDWVTFPNYKF